MPKKVPNFYKNRVFCQTLSRPSFDFKSTVDIARGGFQTRPLAMPGQNPVLGFAPGQPVDVALHLHEGATVAHEAFRYLQPVLLAQCMIA